MLFLNFAKYGTINIPIHKSGQNDLFSKNIMYQNKSKRRKTSQMSIFKTIFGSSDEQPSHGKINWNVLESVGQLEGIITVSKEKPVIIFKHSTRCSISRMALKQFEKAYNLEEHEAAPYFLDLLEHRDVSNAIAAKFGVTHQSPQLLLIKNGQCVYTVSHSDIDAEELKKKI